MQRKVRSVISGAYARAAWACLALATPFTAMAATVEYASPRAFAQAAGQLTTVSFDGVAPPLVEDSFAALGLRIESRSGRAINLIPVPSGWAGAVSANSLPNVISLSITPTGGFADVDDDIDFVFTYPVRAAALWVGNVGPGTTEVQFLDAGGRILARETFTPSNPTLVGTPTDGNNRIFYGVVSDALIARIRTIDAAGDADGVSFDDLQFSRNASVARAAREYFALQPFERAAGSVRALRTLNFESLPAGTRTLTGGEFDTAGVHIRQRDDAPISLVRTGQGFAPAINAASGPHVISAAVTPDGGYVDVADDFDFEFRAPVRAAGLWIGNIGPRETTVQFLDAGGGIIASETLTTRSPGLVGSGDGSNRIFYGVVSPDLPIASIRTIEPAGDSDGVTYDDIVYSANAAVPDRLRVFELNAWNHNEISAGIQGAMIAERQGHLLTYLRRLSPDVLTLQEVSMNATAGVRGDLGEALRRMAYDVFPQLPSDASWTVLASRWPIVGRGLIPLAVLGNPDPPYGALHGRIDLPAPLNDLPVVDYKPEWQVGYGSERHRQAIVLVERLNAIYPGEPIVLGGDFDDVPTSEGVVHVRDIGQFVDAWDASGLDGVTYSCDRNLLARYVSQICGAATPQLHERRIDYLMARPPTTPCRFSGLHWDRTTRETLDSIPYGPQTSDGRYPVSGHYAVLSELVPTRVVCGR